jgi:hypothetical protein
MPRASLAQSQNKCPDGPNRTLTPGMRGADNDGRCLRIHRPHVPRFQRDAKAPQTQSHAAFASWALALHVRASGSVTTKLRVVGQFALAHVNVICASPQPPCRAHSFDVFDTSLTTSPWDAQKVLASPRAWFSAPDCPLIGTRADTIQVPSAVLTGAVVAHPVSAKSTHTRIACFIERHSRQRL